MTSPNNSAASNDKKTLSVSLSDGIRCYFDIGEHTISVWGSGWSGREVVRVDDQVVSESRNLLRLQNRHDFSLDGASYHLVVKTESIIRAQYGVYLYQGDTLVDSDQMGKWQGLRIALLCFTGGIIIGFLAAQIGAWISGGGA
jgi:hypothetical protein